jgi:hypothetical protein
MASSAVLFEITINFNIAPVFSTTFTLMLHSMWVLPSTTIMPCVPFSSVHFCYTSISFTRTIRSPRVLCFPDVSQQRRHRIRKELAQGTDILSFSVLANHCYELHKMEVKNYDVLREREQPVRTSQLNSLEYIRTTANEKKSIGIA